MGALGIGPTLGMRQRGRARGFDFAGGVLPPGASLTRASPATCWSAAGVLHQVAADVARFDHDPATGARRGLLIEGAGGNAMLRSGELGHAVWTAPGLTRTGGLASPDGGTLATMLSDGPGSYGHLSQSVVAASGTMCLSVFVAKDMVGKATRFVVIRIGANIDLALDTATGECAVISGSIVANGVQDCGAWWRVWGATATSISATTLYPACGAGALTLASYQAAVVGNAVMFGPQLESGAAPSSYMASGALPGTRAADLLTLNWGMLGVADGDVPVRYRFDDGSTQDVLTPVAGGIANVPGNLNRRRILSAALI